MLYCTKHRPSTGRCGKSKLSEGTFKPFPKPDHPTGLERSETSLCNFEFDVMLLCSRHVLVLSRSKNILFKNVHVDFSLACAIQFYRSHRSHLDMMHCRIALAKVHKACVWKAQSIHCEETGANKSCCEQTSSKPVAKMMWGGETPSRSIVFVSDHFAKSLSKATSWWSQHKFGKW